MASHTPHDGLVRAVFSRKDEAIGELCAALPAHIVAAIDWSTLELENAHFVDAELADRESDLVYTVNLGGDEVVLYILFEHQSSPDAMMPLRLTSYMVRIWEGWLADHKNAKRLPAILPVVLAHAEHGWNTAVSMLELYDLDEATRAILAPHLLSLTFVLDDIQRKDDLELMSRAMTALARLALLLLRHARDPQGLLDRLLEWVPLLRAVREGTGGEAAFRLLMYYVVLVTEGHGLQDFTRRLEPALGKAAGEQIMTLGEELIAQGVAQGIAQGEAKGVAAGEARSLLKVLAARGFEVSQEQRARIMACTDLAVLERWIEQAVKAGTVGEALE